MAKQHQTTATNDYLLDFLRSLPATGANGFEGLVRDLLEQWTNFSFRIARAGSQFGKDGMSEGQDEFSIAFETKRYNETTELNARELLGELTQAKTSYPELELWVLAATREVGDLAKDLRKGAERLDVDILIVDARVDGVGSLHALCAEYPHVIIQYCRNNNGLNEKLIESLNEIKSHPHYQNVLQNLRTSLDVSIFGKSSARQKSYVWLKDHVTNKDQANSGFFQDIGLFQPGNKRVTRSTINQSLDTWWDNWKMNPSFYALIGEEGTGKTWALFSWLVEKFNESYGPIILPVTTAQLADSSDLNEIIATVLYKRCRKSKDFWNRRIEAWQKCSKSEEPFLLLCLDGLNEHPNHSFWRSIAAQATSNEMFGRIAIIMTSRPEFWRNCVSTGINETVIETHGYDDTELQQVLSASHMSLSQIPQALRPLIRKPR